MLLHDKQNRRELLCRVDVKNRGEIVHHPSDLSMKL